MNLNRSQKTLILAILAVATSVLMTLGSNYLIGKYFPYRPIADDLLFHLVPYSKTMEYVADICAALGGIFLLVLAFKYKSFTAKVFFSLALFYAIRSILNLVTPLGDPSGDAQGYGFLETQVMYGMFPSGHTGIIALGYWWARSFKDKVFMTIFNVLLLGIAVSLLSSRGHYTIDIIGGVVLAYLCVKTLFKDFKKQ